MTAQTLTPTAQGTDATAIDLANVLTAATQTTIQFSNTGREVLYVKNADSGTHTVTVNVGTTVDGQAVSSFTAVNVAAGKTLLFGPFRSVLNQPGTSTVSVTLDATTSITVGLVQNTGVL